jgi:hypothetical protein
MADDWSLEFGVFPLAECRGVAGALLEDFRGGGIRSGKGNKVFRFLSLLDSLKNVLELNAL